VQHVRPIEERVVPDEPFDLEKLVHQAMLFHGDANDCGHEQRVRADFRLQMDYPGQYVVFKDVWSGGERGKGILDRQILVHSTDWYGVSDTTDHPEVEWDYIDDPNTDPESLWPDER
jgi:hypothetical protein